MQKNRTEERHFLMKKQSINQLAVTVVAAASGNCAAIIGNNQLAVAVMVAVMTSRNNATKKGIF